MVGDGECHSWANNIECNFDGGDCFSFNMEYPGCIAKDSWRVGDGECDKENLNLECKYDGLDCCSEDVDGFLHSNKLGDGTCDQEYNTLNCGWDDLDCVVTEFPECRVFNNSPLIIGDNKCHPDYNTEACGFDGWDCCIVPDINLLGNDQCDGGSYNTPECHFYRGDSVVPGLPDCRVDDPSLVGNGNCEGYNSPYNTFACAWDGGDCETAVLNNGMVTLKLHRQGYIDGFSDYNGFEIGAMRMSDGSEFWAGSSSKKINESESTRYIRSVFLPPSTAGENVTSTMIIGNNELKVGPIHTNLLQLSIAYFKLL